MFFGVWNICALVRPPSYIKHVSYPKIIRGVTNMHLHSGKDENIGWSIFIHQAMASIHKDDNELITCSSSSVIFDNTAEEISIGLDYSEVNNDTSLSIDTRA